MRRLRTLTDPTAMPPLHDTLRAAPAALALAVALCAGLAPAADFTVSPTRVELKAGAMSETISVINHGAAPLRASVRLVEWTQDAEGKDVYKETGDLVYFPRQLEVGPDSRRVVRVGAKAPAGVAERTFRLFIEEEPGPPLPGEKAQVSFAFRFGIPVFLPPAVPRIQVEAGEPVLAGGKLSVLLKNTGNRHVRVTSLRVADGAGFSQEVQGWYTLAGMQRTYSIGLSRDACRRGGVLNVTLLFEGTDAIARKVQIDPATCG